MDDLGASLYLIGLGSNLEPRAQHLRMAASALGDCAGKVLAVASIIETAPWGGVATHPFFNTALILESELAPDHVLRMLMDIEQSLGRVRRERWGNRTIDLDILLWTSPSVAPTTRSYRSELVTIPHPKMLERPFVMEPAASIAPTWLHPDSGHALLSHWRGHLSGHESGVLATLGQKSLMGPLLNNCPVAKDQN